MYHNKVIERHGDHPKLKSNKVRVGIEYYISFPLYSRRGLWLFQKSFDLEVSPWLYLLDYVI